MANKSVKRVRSVIAIYAIIIVLYILAFLIIPFPKSTTSWVSFVFTVLSVVVSMLTCGYAFNSKKTMGAIYGFPIFKVGLIYMITQTVVGVVFCIVASFVSVPYWISLILSVLMLGVAIILVIVTGNARDAVEDVEETTLEGIKALSTFNIDIAGIIDACENEKLKAQLQELGDVFKYSSDPVSSDATKDIESQIKKELGVLKELVLTSDIDAATEKAKAVGMLLAERNRICQTNK